MLASAYGFRHIVGIEYSPGLHDIAVENLKNYTSPSQQCTSFEPILGDALAYDLPPGRLVCLIFNSLDPETMSQVLRRFGEAAGARPEPVFILYANLRTVDEIGDSLADTDHLKRLSASNRRIVRGNAAAQVEYSAGRQAR